MAALRTFLKRTVGQHTSNTNHHHQRLNTTSSGNSDSSSDTSLSTTDRSIHQPTDGYNSTSTLGVVTVHSDDSLRPLLHSQSTNRRKKLLSCLTDQTNSVNNLQIMNDNICLIDKTLPKELFLRYEQILIDKN